MSGDGAVPMNLQRVEFAELSFGDRAPPVKDEPSPFGPELDGMQWRPKTVNVGFRDERCRLLAVGGAAVATVEVEGHGRFEVVGKGGLIVRPEARGLGLSSQILKRVREISAGLGPDRAMCFCAAHLKPMYEHFGYREITDPVWVQQPDGPIVMPALAMWQPIRPSEWPPGTVHLDGPPF